MRRYTSSQMSAKEMDPISSMYYYRTSSPPLSRASRSVSAIKIPVHRSSASAFAARRTEKEKESPNSPTRTQSGASKVYNDDSVARPERSSQSRTTMSNPYSGQRQPHSHAFSDQNRASPSSIPHLREALNSLESQMASLMSERRMLESRLEQAVRQQSPVQRLPRELLGSIFEIGVHHLDEEDAVLLSTLMLVCKEWTDVALDTPTLWSRITIENQKCIPKARRKLARSKSVPIDIIIHFGPHFESTQTVIELVVHAMDILRPAMWRWRTFRLIVPNRAHAHAALTQCREPAPLLEDFAVQIHHVLQTDRYAMAPLPLFQGHLPRLRVCSFTSFHFGWHMSLVSRLRVLKLGGFWAGFAPSVGTILNILKACPALEELGLRNMTDVEGAETCDDFEAKESHASTLNVSLFPKESDMISLPKLKKASFYFAGAGRVQALFSQLIFPSLERVEFSYMDNLTPILKHLKRQTFNSLPLIHLRIEACFFNELKLVRFLRRLPSLRTLELIDVEDVSPNFLSGLATPSGGQEWVCPKLEILNFDGCSALDWDSLRVLVEARLPANSSRILNPPSASFARNNTTFISSASSYAAQQRMHHTSALTSSRVSRASSATYLTAQGPVPKRLRVIDLTRCPQFTKEMVQWLRMYVSEVRCESEKTYWGEAGFSA